MADQERDPFLLDVGHGDTWRFGVIKREGEPVAQFALDPATVAQTPILCVGGPCDGQRMRVQPGHVLIVSGGDGCPMRAASLTPTLIRLGQELGTYLGHYEQRGEELHWTVAGEVPRGLTIPAAPPRWWPRCSPS